MYQSLTINHLRVFLALSWLVILLLTSEPLSLLAGYGAFSLLGVVGAIFANATGAGGGVIFVPFFNQLEFTNVTSIATSFAIQCCGMTAGALTWWAFYRRHKQADLRWREIRRTLLLTVPFSVSGIWIGQIIQHAGAHLDAADSLHIGFGLFSILLALAIFATLPLMKKDAMRTRLCGVDALSLPLVALTGGIITAWLSVGVGELVAVYLIMRRFDVTFAIAVAVILSACSVWGGVLYHIFSTEAVYWPVVLFAGAGAIIGGMLAKHLVLYFSPTNLKIFFAAWVFILGVASLPY